MKLRVTSEVIWSMQDSLNQANISQLLSVSTDSSMVIAVSFAMLLHPASTPFEWAQEINEEMKGKKHNCNVNT